MTIKVNSIEQTLLNDIATDINDVNGGGLQVLPSTPIATTMYPIANYATTVPPASDNETKVKDSMVGLFAPIVRYMGPLMGQVSNTYPSPTISFTGLTTLLTYTLPNNLEVERQIEISAQGTCYTDVANTRFAFDVQVNGNSTLYYQYYFNEAGSHRTWAGSWIVTLSPGSNVLTLVGDQTAGTGDIIFDSNDFINMTFRG